MAELIRYTTPLYRASFTNMFEAESYDGGEPKFGLSAIWTPAKFSDKDKALWKKIMKALDDEAQKVFKMPWDELHEAGIKTGIRDGKVKKDLEGYGPGTKFASITSKMRPGLIDRKKLPIIPEGEKARYEAEGKEYSEEEFYPGCICRSTVTIYSFNNKGKGVALGMMNTQKVRDGERLDSRTDAADDFDDDYLDEDEDDFLDD